MRPGDEAAERVLVSMTRLLKLYESRTVGNIDVDVQEETETTAEGPWVIVTIDDDVYAIWKETGAVYRVRSSGAVEDDPFIALEDE